jgi:hypothetical protein
MGAAARERRWSSRNRRCCGCTRRTSEPLSMYSTAPWGSLSCIGSGIIHRYSKQSIAARTTHTGKFN